MIEWSPQQEAAIEKAIAWARADDGPQVHRIFGFAGTGKTTLAKEISAALDNNVRYGAFTGKAASVMRKKGCKDASTLHSLIYKLKEDDEDSGPVFELDANSDLLKVKLGIIDEVSMVDQKLGNDLLSFKTKLLVLGDPAQLPPVEGAGFFIGDAPDTMLTEVHRQARDNPIIRLSMDIREGRALEPGDYGPVKVIRRADIPPEGLKKTVMDADQVICGLNRTRIAYNRRMRENLGRTQPYPVIGDKLICLRNDRIKGIFNGSLWTAQDVKRKRGFVHMKLRDIEADRVRHKGVQVREEFFDGREATLDWEKKRGTQEFTYGYTLTCHKSQGSQWDNVVVFDESKAFREDAAKWAYTAATRAAETLTWVLP